ncbi:membrane protein [Agromyces rhizosphaerae]|uniref:Membrane protein n=1 Tax=Agromyces rhizosphaerae TaxID=88374 RepID=A0A9W6FPU3_9MICO|nr:AEC family transporter [Agromyces rhizosphaerae]GLI27825.1 membrane protein [Agromyces rhizosphaerae]
MLDVLTGFAVIAVAILVGWVAGRSGVLGPHARYVLSRLAFSVLGPFLLFSVLASADVGALFSALLPVSFIAAASMFVVYAAVALIAWRRPVGHVVIGSMGSGYVNGNNIGIPISVYMLGDAAFSAPVVLLQLLLFMPAALSVLDVVVRGGASVWRTVLRALANPIIIGSLLGVLVSITGLELPAIVTEPIALVGQAAVPVMLIAYGISLHGQRPLAPGSGRRDVVLASALKLVAMPLVAWAVGRFAFGLDGHTLYAVTVLAALPSAQNVFNIAQRYDTAEIIARDTVLITTVGAVPVLFLVSLLLGV